MIIEGLKKQILILTFTKSLLFTSRFSICFFWIWAASFWVFSELVSSFELVDVWSPDGFEFISLIKLSEEELGVIEVDEVPELDEDGVVCWVSLEFSLDDVIMDWKFRTGLKVKKKIKK